MAPSKNTNIVEQFAAATRQRRELVDSLPTLQRQAEEAATHRKTATELLELHEGDALIGKVADSVLATTRARHEAAVIADRKASASVRQAHQDLVRLDEAIERLTPEAHAVRLGFFESRQAQLAQELLAKLEAVLPLNQALEDNLRAALAEFPHVVRRDGSSLGYPVAAGLTDLSFTHLRANRGYFAAWRNRVDAFLNPKPAQPTRRAQAAPGAAAQRSDGPWHPLPEAR